MLFNTRTSVSNQASIITFTTTNVVVFFGAFRSCFGNGALMEDVTEHVERLEILDVGVYCTGSMDGNEPHTLP